MKYYITILLLIILIFSQAWITNGEQAEKTDCNYLLIITHKIVVETSKNPVQALRDIKAVLRAKLPPQLSSYHKEFYHTLATYTYSLIAYKNSWGNELEIFNNISKVYTSIIRDYKEYQAVLLKCARDPQVAVTASTLTTIAIKKNILVNIDKLAESILAEESLNKEIQITIGKPVYTPGETAHFLVKLDNISINNITIAIAQWPTLEVVRYVHYNITDGLITARVRIPYANELVRLGVIGGETIGSIVKLAVVVFGTSPETGSRVFAFKLFQVKYKIPKVYIQAPEAVAPGEPIEFSVISDAFYPNVTILVNEKPLWNTSLSPGTNNYTLAPGDYNDTSGRILVLGVRIPPGTSYLGVERAKPILVVERGLPVKIGVPPVIYTWSGEVVVKVEGNLSDYSVYEKIGFIRLYGKQVSQSVYKVFGSILPITPASINVEAVLEGNNSNNTITISKNIIIINPLYLSIVALIIIGITAYPETMQEIILLPLSIPTSRARGARRPGARAGYRTWRIKSKIAELYYKVLLSLEIELPRPYETLREHFSRISIGGKLRKALWMMLRLAEEDLYSPRKPPYSEVEEALREVTRNTKK